MGIKDEELEGLSDEERAALAEDDEDADILKSIAGDDANDADEEDDSDADDPAADADDVDAAAADAAAVAAAAAAADGADADAADNKEGAADAPVVVADEFRPEFKAERPEGITEKLAELDTQTKELLAKFKEGQIELPEFMAQKDAIDAEKTKLALADAQAQWAENQNADMQAQRWKWEQERFFGQEKAAIYKDPIVLAALNASVQQISADPANAKKPMGFFLEEADRQIRKRFNMGGEPPPAAKDNKPANRQPDLSNVPKTLAQLPAAEMAETGSDEFAYLEKLDGIALEQALRKLTPEQEARYLGAAA